jgi:SNF2 family DNA or RNA helicase
MEILDEHGVVPETKADSYVVDQQVVVFSQFSRVVDMVAGYLAKKHVNVEKLTGATSPNERTRLQERFQAKDISVLCMTTTAGGVAITLDQADTCVFMDETWDPGDQEQAEDRIHRASRIHNVTVYTLRTKKTIEEYISRVLTGKESVNKMILDLRAAGLRATEKA